MKRLLSIGLLIAGITWAQRTMPGGYTVPAGGTADQSAGQWKPPEKAYASLPAAASCSGCVFVVTDAVTAGSCAAGSGTARALCRSTGSAYEAVGDGTGAAAGTLNSNGLGWAYLLPIPGYSSTGASAVTANANRGYLIQRVAQQPIEWRKVSFWVVAADAAAGIKVCVWNSARTSLLAESSIDTSGTTGAKSLTWSTGSAVSGGVFTEPRGVNWWGITSNSTTATIRILSSPPEGMMGLLQNESKVFYPSGTISSGSGGSVACTADVSALTQAGIGQAFSVWMTN